jgi:hypothetical protein
VPATGSYTIEVGGAKGGNTTLGNIGGQGARISGNFNLTKGDVIKILVGQIGGQYQSTAGGGGGTFVVTASNTPLIVAGGGGGGGNSGGTGKDASYGINGVTGYPGYAAGVNGYGSTDTNNGGWGQSGAGFNGNGNGYQASSWGDGTVANGFLNGGVGASPSSYNNPTASCSGAPGGFGGGGSGACNGGGGAGGYSGGGSGGGAGGSYCSVTQTNIGLQNEQGYVTITANVTTKGTLTNPGTSGIDIKNSGVTTSGWYYVKTSTMPTPKQVYINMVDDGGGWMLISYNPNAATTPGMYYPASWTNGQGTLNKLRINAMDVWFNNGTYQCTSVLKMASNSTADQVPILANMTIANKVVYSSPGVFHLDTSNPDSPSILDATNLNGTWSPVKGHTLMTTSLSVSTPADWLYNAGTSAYWTVSGPSTDTAIRSGNGAGTGSWTNITTTAYYGMINVAPTGSSYVSLLYTYAFYVR